MQSWNDVRCLANIWDLLDDLPEYREVPSAPLDVSMALQSWRNSGNMAHLGLGERLGEGNFSEVYAYQDTLAAKITRVVSRDAASSGFSGRDEVGMSYSGSLDMGPLFADFCMTNRKLLSLPRVLGYARNGDSWLIVTEKLLPIPEEFILGMQDATGDIAGMAGGFMELFAGLPRENGKFSGVHRRFAQAVDAVWDWALELDTLMPVFCDLHRRNIMRRPRPVDVLFGEPELIIVDPLLCYRG